MSIDYTFYMVVGFQITESEMYNAFCTTTTYPAISHMEDRFDPKTGQKISPVMVVDKPEQTEEIWSIDGEVIDIEGSCDDDLTLALERKLGCSVEIRNGVSNEYLYDFFLHPIGGLDINEGRVSIFNASMSMKEIIQMAPQLEELAYKMRKIGLKPGEPKVYISGWIG